MTAKKEHFHFEEHMLAGEILRRAEGDLVLLAMAAHDAYGKGMFNRIMRLAKASAKIRSALQGKVGAEHPHTMEAMRGVLIENVYLGTRQDVPIKEVQGAPHDFRSELRKRAGLAETSPEEKRAGRPRALDAKRLVAARKMLAEPSRTIEGVAAELGIAASTLYRYVPGGRSAVLDVTEAEKADSQPPA